MHDWKQESFKVQLLYAVLIVCVAYCIEFAINKRLAVQKALTIVFFKLLKLYFLFSRLCPLVIKPLGVVRAETFLYLLKLHYVLIKVISVRKLSLMGEVENALFVADSAFDVNF